MSGHYEETTDLMVEASDLVSGDRKLDYGDFLRNHQDIAKVWSVVLGTPISAHQVTLCMASLKIVRASQKKNYKRDNYVDAIAYLSMTNALQKKENGDL